MKVCAHQPTFLPWIGFWHKVVSTDITVFLSHVQYTRGNVQNRCRLGGRWLTLPVTASLDTTLEEAQVHPLSLRQAAQTIQQTLGSRSHPYRHRIKSIVEFLTETDKTSLAYVNIQLAQLIARQLGHSMAASVL